QLKQHLSELPLLVAPKPKEELIVYLSASHGAISAVLMNKRGTVQTPFYFVSRALQRPELNYTLMEKLVLALVFSAKRLRRYFHAHDITVITDQPIKQIISRPDVAGRLQKWSVMLGEHNITYRPRTSVKPDEAPPDTLVAEIPQEPWTLFPDGSSCVDGSGAGLILTSPGGTEFTYALRFQFTAPRDIRCQRRKYGQVLVEVLKEKSIQEEEIEPIVKEEGPTWMTPIIEYLKDGTLPEDRKEASKLCIKARQYELLEGVLYRSSFLKPWLRCVGPLQANYVIREIHEGSCIAMDYFTKWIEAKAVATITGYQVKKFMWDNIVCRFGLPREIVSDNGKQFSDNPFKDWCEKLNITQRFASVKHLQSNGLVERANHRAWVKEFKAARRTENQEIG
ncbi:reverse transcriptase domain-containing protein, partial [Tanacetum coccineum]